jgi:hypothetical protein
MAMRIQKRYRISSRPGGLWQVMDIFLGMPVMLNDMPLIDMNLRDAEAAADTLNALEVNRLGQAAD